MPPARSPFRRTAGRLEDYAYLRELGLTQVAAAERMGVSPRTIARYAGRLRQAPQPAAPSETPDRTGGPPGPRKGCGTYLAYRLHQVLGEEPCPECLSGELLRRVGRVPLPSLAPIAAAEAARDITVLAAKARSVRKMAPRVCRNAGCACPEPAHPHRDGWRCGYCRRCYARWMEHGFPASGPPSERIQIAGHSSAGRVEDYAGLRAQGLSRAAAALRLGVTIRSALRYESRLRREGIAA